MENCQWCLDDRWSLHAIHTKWCSRCWLYGGRVKMWVSSQASASVEHEVRINGRLISVIGAERNRLCISWSTATVCVLTYFFLNLRDSFCIAELFSTVHTERPGPCAKPNPLGSVLPAMASFAIQLLVVLCHSRGIQQFVAHVCKNRHQSLPVKVWTVINRVG